MHYENLSHEEQKLIWAQFFKKLQTERRKHTRIHHSAREYVFKNKDLRRERTGDRLGTVSRSSR